ncbi:MAG: hypothetical protein Q9173_005715 [Seirophora scorigena]
MTETFAGSSFSRAEKTLARLADDPDRLDRARRRFSASPPSFTFSKGPDSTLTNSPGAEVGPHVSGVTQKDILEERRMLSRPRPQFDAQHFAEQARLIEHGNKGVHLVAFGTDYDDHSYALVKRRWQEQGIWSHEWDCKAGSYRFGHKWMHEEPSPPDAESEPTIDAEKEHSCHLLGVPPPPERRKSEETSEQREIKHQKPESSRPIHQFLWQITHERDRISGEPTVGKVAALADLDINTKAYENVKEWWLACHIWDNKWGILPGMTWKHERPLEWPPKDDPEPASEAAFPNLVNGNNGGEELMSLKSFLGSPDPPSNLMPRGHGALPASLPQLGLGDGLCHPCQWHRDPLCKDCGLQGSASGVDVNDEAGQWTSQAAPWAGKGLFGHLVPNTLPTLNWSFHLEDQPRAVGMDDVIVDSQPHPLSQSIADSSVERPPQKRPRGRPKKTRNGKVAKVQSGPSLGRINAPSISKPQRKSTRGRGRPKNDVQDDAAKGKATLSAVKQAATAAPRRSKRAR